MGGLFQEDTQEVASVHLSLLVMFVQDVSM